MIKSVHLHNFKCYKDQPFDFSNLTVFCGNNSVGKSTAIQSILLMLQAKFRTEIPFNGRFVSLGNYDDVHNNKAKDDEVISMSIEFKNEGCLKWYNNLDIKKRAFVAEESNITSYSALETLESYQYIEAERLGPRDNYANSVDMVHSKWLGTKGEYASEILSTIASFEKFESIDVSTNSKQTNPDDCRIHPSLQMPQISNSIDAWMKEISPGFSVESSNEERANVSFNSYSHDSLDGNLRSSNVGFGLSYSLSVVASLLLAPVGGLVIIENPEAHLHPRGQSYLGRLIALTAEAGVQVIVETHSDHIINGIRVIARLRDTFDTEQFNLYYVSQQHGAEETSVDKITLNSSGKLSKWPDGFFDQQAIDMKTLITGTE
jgi:predicted ATPase